MKKIITLTLLSVCCFATFAGNRQSSDYQSEERKVHYGPQAGTFALSFGALPVIDFVGNMFNGTSDQSFDGLAGLGSSIFDGTTIDMKFYTSDKLGIVLGAGFNCQSRSNFEYDYASEDELIAKNKDISNQLILTLGAQYVTRPGKRLQPVVGTRLLYAFQNRANVYNDMDDSDNDYKSSTPSSTIGLVLDLGVEYFLSQSVSLSAYADLGLYKSVTKSKYDAEDTDYSKKTSSRIAFGTGQLGGNIALNFYF